MTDERRPITTFDREQARDVMHVLVQAQQQAKWMQEHIEPLEWPALYAALQHISDGVGDVEEALNQVWSLIKPVGE